MGPLMTPRSARDAPPSFAGAPAMGAAQPGEENDRAAPGTQQADPVEEVQHKAMIAAAAHPIYSERTLDALAASSDPLEGAARITAYTMHSIKENLEKRGKQVSEDALLDAGRNVLDRALGIAVAAELVDPETAREGLDEAGAQALQIYDQIRSGGAPEPGMQAPPDAAPQPQRAMSPQGGMPAGGSPGTQAPLLSQRRIHA